MSKAAWSFRLAHGEWTSEETESVERLMELLSAYANKNSIVSKAQVTWILTRQFGYEVQQVGGVHRSLVEHHHLERFGARHYRFGKDWIDRFPRIVSSQWKTASQNQRRGYYRDIKKLCYQIRFWQLPADMRGVVIVNADTKEWFNSPDKESALAEACRRWGNNIRCPQVSFIVYEEGILSGWSDPECNLWLPYIAQTE
jgi:hypothetical protein